MTSVWTRRPQGERWSPGCFRVRRRLWPAVMVIAGTLAMSRLADAQVRGVYPTGMNATNAGVTPASGLTYSNLFIFNSRDESKGPDGEVVATGSNAVMIDLNTFVWVGRRTWLGGARFSATATLLVSNNSLASDTEGQLSAGGGFGDSFYQPFILGWTTNRVDIRTVYRLPRADGKVQCGGVRQRGLRLLDTGAVGRPHGFSHERQDDNDLGISHVQVPHGPGGHGHSSRPDRQHRLLRGANDPGQ